MPLDVGEDFVKEDVTKVHDIVKIKLLHGLVLLYVGCTPIQMLYIGLNLPINLLHHSFAPLANIHANGGNVFSRHGYELMLWCVWLVLVCWFWG
jgi:hypothetical protein